MAARLLPPLLPQDDRPSLWIVLYAARRRPAGLPTHINPDHRLHNINDEQFNWAFVVGTHSDIEERTGIRYSIWQLPAESPTQKYWEWLVESKLEAQNLRAAPSYGAIGPPIVRLRVAEIRDWSALERHIGMEEYVTYFEKTSTSKRWVRSTFELLRMPVPKKKCFSRVTGKLWKEIESYCVQYAEQEADARVRRKETSRKRFFRWSGNLPLWDLVEAEGSAVEVEEGLSEALEEESSEDSESESEVEVEEELTKRLSEGSEKEAGDVSRAVLSERVNGS